MVIYEANSAKMTLQSLLLSFVWIESKFICSVHLHIFIYTFEVQNLSGFEKNVNILCRFMAISEEGCLFSALGL